MQTFSTIKIRTLRYVVCHLQESLRTYPRKTPILLFNLREPMSWSCKKCTFINSPSPNSTCQLCLSPRSPPPSPSASSSSVEIPKWSCKACTFLNPFKNSNCQICDTRAPVGSLSNFKDLNDIGDDGDLDSSIGSVFLPLRPCKRKVRDPVDGDRACAEFGDFRGVKASPKVVSLKGSVGLGSSGGIEASNKELTAVKGEPLVLEAAVLRSIKILSYNVWFREDLELHKRMKALGDLIQLHSPDIINLQEVTPNIYDIFRQSGWWEVYGCSVSKDVADSRPYFCMQLSKLPVKSFSSFSFANSIMGRELCITEVEIEGKNPLIVATCHLESPCPAPPTWDQMFSKERVDQAKEAIDLLKKNNNVIFGGDMNWDDKLDGQFPLPDGWVDAWAQLRPGDNGWTYDTKSNQMLSGNRTLQKRLDRFVCKLHDFQIDEIKMIGKEAIPGLAYIKEKKVRKEVKMLELPVLPSDHYGLLLTIGGQ
ncbi:hypothetical protein K2173_004670 [Erythroxylum novogranatense]|uniref:RanBP2-type domain-containing protein n=1 Tax=Erythroxylum novogranatense TaxID=1862640 RepID=A0AAV8T619_9ROSI|nr:hypothetical protein K2173_004670 [Erythroxylum novogranatense]